jgi:hypothetical protein
MEMRDHDPIEAAKIRMLTKLKQRSGSKVKNDASG